MQVLVALTDRGDGPVAEPRDPEQPLLHVDDLAAVRGDGVFETLLVRDGVVREEQAHLDRLARSAAMLDLAVPGPDAWRGALRAVRDGWAALGHGDDLVVRLACSRGREGTGAPTAWATGAAVSPVVVRQRAEGVSALVLDRGTAAATAGTAPWLLLGAKTLSYAVNQAALRHAAAAGVDDVVFRSSDGQVLEGPTSTVVLALPGRVLVTPPDDVGILPGTTQRALFRAAAADGWRCEVRPVAVAELAGAAGLWLVSSVRLAAPVHTLDGAAVAVDPELTAAVAALLEAPDPAGRKAVAPSTVRA
ncbi:aminodeoxychorismate lyase [Rhodococcus aerolatus]